MTVRNHNRSTALVRSVLKYWGTIKPRVKEYCTIGIYCFKQCTWLNMIKYWLLQHQKQTCPKSNNYCLWSHLAMLPKATTPKVKEHCIIEQKLFYGEQHPLWPEIALTYFMDYSVQKYIKKLYISDRITRRIELVNSSRLMRHLKSLNIILRTRRKVVRFFLTPSFKCLYYRHILLWQLWLTDIPNDEQIWPITKHYTRISCGLKCYLSCTSAHTK